MPTLSYRDAGTGDLVVLLHGQGGDGSAWSAQADALAARYRVVSVDLRGHGRSGLPPAPWTMSDLAADVATLLDTRGPAHVVGHSLGGMVALQLALDAPHAVRSLTVVNSAAQGQGVWVRTLAIQAFIRVFGMRTFARANTTMHFPDAGQEPLRQRLVADMGACSPDGYLRAQAAVDAFDVGDRLGEIACPVLVVHAAQDLIPLADKELIVARVQHGRLATIGEARHVVVWDQPERLNAVLLAFLAAPHG